MTPYWAILGYIRGSHYIIIVGKKVDDTYHTATLFYYSYHRCDIAGNLLEESYNESQLHRETLNYCVCCSTVKLIQYCLKI